jgi:glyoxylase-like metal-dependent hydrolase (beta-lactamase superfamily II)
MIEEIAARLYRIEIPLPQTPLKALNTYLLHGAERSLLVDTGFNHPICLEAMQAALKKIQIDLAATDIFITHLHADHFGLAGRLATPTTRVYFNRPEAEIIEHWQGFGPMLAYAGRHGFPRERLQQALQAHPGGKFGSEWTPPLQTLEAGNVLAVDDDAWHCIATPGHTRGHICLYEPDHKLLIAGDHILDDITPNIQCWSDDENPLQDYLQSLAQTAELEVDLVLPGHRRLIDNHRRRIDELRRHHDQRLAEVLALLADSPLNACETAARMHWDIRARGWHEFPTAQQWFALGEALSHLRFLEARGLVARCDETEPVRFMRVA